MEKDLPPKISVIIPVYNGAEFISAALKNVLEQNIDALEIIVVNDGSTDDTVSAISVLASEDSPYSIEYLEQTNKGPAAARNLGLKVAQGEFVAFLDCDDVWSQNNLLKLSGVLHSESEVDVVLGKIQPQIYDKTCAKFKSNGSPTFSLSLVAMLARRSSFEKVGLFDESIWIGEDKDWFIRCVEKKVCIRYLSDHISQFYRRHDYNMTNNMNSSESYWLELLRSSLRRRALLKAGESTKNE